MEWTGARYADKPTAEATTWIDSDPEAVWPFVADVRLMPELSDELQRVEWAGDASGPRVGGSFVGYSKHEALGEWSTTSFIVECEEPRVFAWAVADPETPTATWRFTLAPENGGTRLTQWMQLGPARSGLSLAIDRMPDKEQKIVFVRMREFENAMTATVAAIKDRVEAVR
ncbi:SRPBCC family protein [Amycolatopsis sp. FDAARGOS 1241]|uniref:SRPBCC family protein n=1 Tax=Amycolatopsis sp. FDAARGOS 1241 TaxID=2778070 RepID=UPI0019511046|nr:SRPBCC family protein [Amycolatopsis sp. FDAARGOS 1241]QRP47573.1 SRPBCC family protein [Amycolatopsis sp. FDAARGOS 1241]